ncbi:uncharacterized protein LOC143352171 [Halictus rubicundus]|uniref:uncharacterized protein LOC143352171 n=1 Tax=Halictus rubicundus TaxID=77578 RepID=UPI0040354FB3
MQSICCGCLKSIPVDERKNIFDENLWISIHSKNSEETKENMKQIKLSDSIELITGLKIIETNQQLVNLCSRCFQHVQSYINLRTQLLISLCSSNNASISNANVKNTNIVQNEKAICSLENANTIDSKLIRDETVLEYAVNNTVETDIPLYNVIDNNNSIDNITKLENEQENNTSNSLKNSNVDYGSSISRKIDFKNQDNDIESEIDVCSGEDEEILELDDQRRTVNIIEIDTTSESDIEVCDYEPLEKRLKNYHAFSSRLLF